MSDFAPLGRRDLLIGAAAAAAVGAAPGWAQATPPTVPVRIDTRKVAGALPHIWEECVGSDRAAMTLREPWRRDMDRMRNETGTRRVRFHGIFNEELGVFAPTILNRMKPTPNFQRIDQVYDGLLDRGVKPFVELSFMPKALAAGNTSFMFYGGVITPPKSNEAWADFIRQFVVHLIDRYGIAEVRSWPFEVWNEPNLGPFWTGTQQQYFDMYKATAVAIKAIDPAIQVGGPSTSAGSWVGEFAAFCSQNNAPVDFFTTHVYAGDNQAKLFGAGQPRVPINDVIPKLIAQVRGQIDASAHKGKPLYLTEWSSDSPAMIAHVIANSLGHCQMMSQWCVSNEFEELGVADYILKEGDIGWGMLTAGIARPSFNTYKLLHALGDRRLEADGPALASLRGGKVSALVWNLAEVAQPAGIPGASTTRTVKGEAKRIEVEFAGARAGQPARVRYVDQERGSPMPAWRAMGSPQYPKPAQLAELRRRADIPPAQTLKLGAGGKLALDLPPEGVALIELV